MKSIALFLAISIGLTTVMPSYARGGGFGGGGFGGGRSFGGGGFGGGRSFGGDGGFRGGDGGFRGGDGGFRGGDGGFRGSDGGFRGGDGGFRGGDNGFSGRQPQNFGGGFNDISQSRGAGNLAGRSDSGAFANHPNFGGNAGDRSGNFANNHPNASGDFSNWKNGGGDNFHHFDPSNSDWHNNSIRNSGNTFTQNNFNRYGAYGGYGAYGHPYGYGGMWGYPGAWGAYGWGAATAWTCMGLTTLTSFLGLAALAGSGNNNGNNGNSVSNVTYEGPNVYVNGNPAGTQEQYYDQAQQLASVGQQYVDTTTNAGAGQPTGNGQNSQWQPLGVFSLAQKGQTQSSMLFQLAINKDGIVRGNYMNQLTNENDQVYGSLDKNTQRISFTIGQNTGNSTVFDTSLADMTKDDAPVLVHYGPNNTQAMMLVRLPAPQGNATS